MSNGTVWSDRRASTWYRWVAAAIVLVVWLATSARSDVAFTPVATTCDSVGYDYDAAGRLVGVHDQGNLAGTYQYDDAGNMTSVNRIGSPSLSVASFVPVAAPVGASVTISGGCFAGDSSDYDVAFNGMAATISEVSQHRIVAVVPPGATTGPITVTGGGTSTTTSTNFQVSGSLAAPTVTGVLPEVVAPGDTLTVVGTGFATTAAENVVWLNATQATVLWANSTNLSVRVPTGAASGRVRVRTFNGQASSPSDVFVAPAGYTVAEVAGHLRSVGGSPQTVALPGSGQLAVVTFDLAKGERASVQASATSTHTCPAPLAVLDPFGRTVPMPTALGSCLTRFVDAFRASVAGTYSLLLSLDEDADTPGPISLTVHHVPPDLTGSVTVGGAALPLAFAKPGQNASITFAASAGQRVGVQFTPQTLNPAAGVRITMLAADGSTKLSTVFDSGDAAAVVLAAAGDYRIAVDPQGAMTGTASLRLFAVPADVTAVASIDGTAVTVTTTVPGQNAEVTFQGQAGKKLYVRPTSPLDCKVQLDLWRPGDQPGGQLTVTFLNRNLGPSFTMVAGSYRMVFDLHCATPGSVTVRLYTDSPDATATTTIGGAAVSVSTAPFQKAAVTFAGTAGQRIAIQFTDSTYAGDEQAAYEVRTPTGQLASLRLGFPSGQLGPAATWR